MLLGVVSAPHAADLHNGCATLQTTVEPATQTAQVESTANATKPADKTAATSQKKSKSVLDAESLESPLSFLKDITPADEESEMSVKPSVMMLALKALVATLLSTIM
ncbi:hypothetical protein [Pontibacter roseus]|uniref:hypothetical protein n=1 Tax=Pontibacter roseus TaxID=336989 RepID=UPI00037A41E6|nr:hypothetical protein [Pontibacter roseus]